MTALTKAEIAEMLYEELGINKREAKDLVDLFFEEIRVSLEANEEVKLSGFGNFEFSVPSGYFALITKNLAEYGYCHIRIVLIILNFILRLIFFHQTLNCYKLR